MSFWKKPNFVSSSIKFYDYLVNNLNCKYAWRCDKSNIINNYNKNIKLNHLEIGPGSGYFLKKCRKIDNLTLMDINLPILEESRNNLIKYYPNTRIVQHDIFTKPFNFNFPINSVGINYVLHCVPGSLENKLEKLCLNLPDKIIIFGATVISDYEKQTLLSKTELQFLNSYGIFNNSNDFSSKFISFVSKNNLNYSYNIVGNVLIFEILNKKV